jgi:hypothetical protein
MSPPPLLTRTRTNRPIIPYPRPLRTRHQNLPRALSLLLNPLSDDFMALLPHESHERDAHQQRTAQQHNIDRHGVAVECAMGGSVEGRLREVEEAGEADDEAVDFAEGGEAEDFGGVVAWNC